MKSRPLAEKLDKEPVDKPKKNENNTGASPETREKLMRDEMEICICGHQKNLHDSETPQFLKLGFHKMALGCDCKWFVKILVG